MTEPDDMEILREIGRLQEIDPLHPELAGLRAALPDGLIQIEPRGLLAERIEHLEAHPSATARDLSQAWEVSFKHAGRVLHYLRRQGRVRTEGGRWWVV